MGSTILSRFLPQSTGNQSVYEAIKEHDEAHYGTTADRAVPEDDTAIDDRNLNERFHDQDIDHLLAEAIESESAPERSTVFENDPQAPPTQSPELKSVNLNSANLQAPPPQPSNSESPDVPGTRQRRHISPTPRWMRSSRNRILGQREAEDVAESLIVEDNDDRARRSNKDRQKDISQPRLPSPVPGPSTKNRRVQWDVPEEQSPPLKRQDIHKRLNVQPRGSAAFISASPADKAMWRWANVENLDIFLQEVYDYFEGKGFWSINLSRLLSSLTLAFVVGLSVFLSFCIDYKKLPGSTKMPEILIPKCTQKMSGLANFVLWLFSFYWMAKLVQYVIDIRRLWHLHQFFKYVLCISEDELQTITWQAIVGRLMDLRDANPTTALNIETRTRKFIGDNSRQRMDAHDIANRLMRKENYLIALFNKDILDLSLPIPFFQNRQLFSRNLEWNINLCVMDYVFNEQGQVKQLFLKDTHRRELVEGLQRRFLIAGFINVVCAPFVVPYFLMKFFLRYFTEFQKNPAQLGARSYTPLAEWKFREFNELWNFFERRLNMSAPFASKYLDQFPKEKTVQVAKFVAFVAGALASVLAAASLLDPDSFIGFDITPERTVLFYLGVLGTIWAVARGMVPEDNFVFDPEYAIGKAIGFTHYCPSHWEGRLHSEEVRREFSMLYQMRVVIFLEEILSILFTPFVLWFSLPNCSERLVDFFREFTIHVDGLGYVCSFALFNFQRGGIGVTGRRASDAVTGCLDPALRDDYYSAKDDKTLASYYSFVDSYANKPKHDTYHRTRRGRVAELKGRSPHSSPSRRPTKMPDGRGSIRKSNPKRHDDHDVPSDAEEDIDPSPSLLLDPQHQPHRIGRQGAAARKPMSSRRSTTGAPRSPRRIGEEDDTDADEQTAHDDPITSSAIIEADSNLGDSWKVAQAAASNGGDERSNFQGASGNGGQGGQDAGVLGLLYQFQKAHTEGRGGVNI
ncbi:MAG: autophagy protein atg9 [Alyxoria varia]|nr:MAG: autophagy protein atg9 [Alyxoria varia]